ncbi:gamma-glutamyltransferase [soil metagenome]
MNKIFIIFLFLISVSINSCYSQTDTYNHGMVSSADEVASQVGIDILKKGGNAIDAAIGVGFALAVVYPNAGNIGGGGFMVIHLSSGKNTTIDYRETAPGLAGRDMYLDKDGNVILNLSTLGHLAGGVPGSVAGMLYALDKYGTMSREEVMKYAIDYAEKGFKVHKRLADNIKDQQENFNKFSSTSKIFNSSIKEGKLFKQKDLAETLKRISKEGRDGFYKGKTAGLIVDEMKKGNGLISYSDLEKYDPVEREPVTGSYRGYKIVSMPPPSSGGICLIYLLNILENYDLGQIQEVPELVIHIMVEAMRRVYADRSEYMGDPDFFKVPTGVLLSKDYAKLRMSDYDPLHASISSEIKPGNIVKKESDQTTHYSVADSKGNLVSVTTTLNDNFGSKLVIDGAGFILNDEMDDFSSKPGVPNMYGLVGSEANSIQPGKRMLSSMTPTLIFKDDKPFMVIGSPGGGRIITSVLRTIINVIDFKMDLTDAIDKPRFHHQWLPDEIQIEHGFLNNAEVIDKLKNMGYTLKEIPDFGRIDAIIFNEDGSMSGHSDIRGYGKAVGY